MATAAGGHEKDLHFLTTMLAS
nr:MetaGeneMark_Unknown Function [uncultured bacterium]